MTADQRDVDTPAPPDSPRWGWPDVVVAFVVGYIASALGFVVLAAAKGVPVDDLGQDVLTIGEIGLLQAPLYLGLLGVPLLATVLRGNGPRTDLGLWTTARDIPTGLGIGLACQFLLVPIVTLPIFLLTDEDRSALEAPARELTDKAQEGWGVAILALVVVVGAPLAEEVFYRGLLQRTLARSLPVWLTVLTTAVVFGLSHLQLLQLPALVAFGIVLSWVAHRTGRLGRNIWAHVGFNATTIVALLAGG